MQHPSNIYLVSKLGEGICGPSLDGGLALVPPWPDHPFPLQHLHPFLRTKPLHWPEIEAPKDSSLSPLKRRVGGLGGGDP